MSNNIVEIWELSSDGYPIWFKESERHLLEIPLPPPNIVVAKDGSGQFQTIGQAVAAYPAGHQGRFNIYVKVGVYEEQVTINQSYRNVFIYGDGIGKTIVTGNKNGADLFKATTFGNDAFGFMARRITFRNTAGPEGEHPQAPAFRSQGDNSAMFECSFEGYQDTLFYQDKKQFYRNCSIYGTVDFIFGYGQALIQESDIIVRKPPKGKPTVITSDGRKDPNGTGGLVIQNCRITPDSSWSPIGPDEKTYLGRPWKAFARTVVMQSYLDAFINPEGWLVFEKMGNEKTCQVFEYSNRGPGANTDRRSKLFLNFKVLQMMEAQNFTVDKFLAGETWLPQTGFPFNGGLYNM